MRNLKQQCFHKFFFNCFVLFQILLRFTYVLMKLKLYEEAVSYYLRLLAIREDVKETLNDDMLEFRLFNQLLLFKCSVRRFKCNFFLNKVLFLCVLFKELLCLSLLKEFKITTLNINVYCIYNIFIEEKFLLIPCFEYFSCFCSC